MQSFSYNFYLYVSCLDFLFAVTKVLKIVPSPLKIKMYVLLGY